MNSVQFAELVMLQFPALRDDILEWAGHIHLQVMELELLLEKAAGCGEWDTVEACINLAHRALCEGDEELRNAICVSLLEELPREGVLSGEIVRRLTPELRGARADLLAYLHNLHEQ